MQECSDDQRSLRKRRVGLFALRGVDDHELTVEGRHQRVQQSV
jgi:hypothetical protein